MERQSRVERRRAQSKEEILRAARAVLLARGVAGLTLAAVAREVGLTKPALYYYFASKEALLFELVFDSLEREVSTVEAAVARTTSGADAIEAQIRAMASHYAQNRDALRLAYLHPQVAADVSFDTAMLARLRPFNDRAFGPVAARIDADREAGRVDASVSGRLLSFLAATAVVGLMTVRGLVEATDEAPLVHSDEALIDELVRSFRARLTPS